MFIPDKTKFRNATGQLYTRRIFLETSYRLNDRDMVQYTLADRDHPDGYPSLKKIYLNFEDPYEFSFGETYLASYEHWKILCEANWFRPLVEEWREELAVKLKQKAFQTILQTSRDADSKQQFEALKIVLNGGWRPKEEKRKAGRPSKEEIKGHLLRSTQEDEELQQELKRVNGHED